MSHFPRHIGGARSRAGFTLLQSMLILTVLVCGMADAQPKIKPSPPKITPRSTEPRPSKEGIDFFEKKIRPLLADNCYNCHSANTNSKGGLRVDDRNGLLQGGGRGPAASA